MEEYRAFPVRLPSGVRYWTVVDGAFRVHEAADGFLLHMRLGRDLAESSTRAYAISLALFFDWCSGTGLEWQRAPRALGRFVHWLRYHDAGRDRAAGPVPAGAGRAAGQLRAGGGAGVLPACRLGRAGRAGHAAGAVRGGRRPFAAGRGPRRGPRRRPAAAPAPAARAGAPGRGDQRRGHPGAAAGVPERAGPVHRAGAVADGAAARRAGRAAAGGRAPRPGRHPARLRGEGAARPRPAAGQPQRGGGQVAAVPGGARRLAGGPGIRPVHERPGRLPAPPSRATSCWSTSPAGGSAGRCGPAR